MLPLSLPMLIKGPFTATIIARIERRQITMLLIFSYYGTRSVEKSGILSAFPVA
jgi:hypothetical protein